MTRRHASIILVACAALLIVGSVASPAMAAPGDPDPVCGTVSVAPDRVREPSDKAVLTPDDMLVGMIGYESPSKVGDNFLVYRVRSSGTLDETLSGDGMRAF